MDVVGNILLVVEPGSHAQDEELERYSLGDCAGEESEMLEEHLLVCERCRARAEEHDLFTDALTGAAAQCRAEHPVDKNRSLLTRWVLPIAAIVLLGVGAVLFQQGAQKNSPAVAIALSTTRGAVPGAHASARRPLALRPDLTGVAIYTEYSLELVNRVGGKVARSAIAPGGSMTIPALQPGAYFVRLYSPAGELLREYALSVSE
jgi:hypothetical protein